MTKSSSMRRLGGAASLWVVAATLLFASSSRAVEPLKTRHRMENRFLIVIDISSAMKSRAHGVEEAVDRLLKSGMKGELRQGDTIGLWTYSERLNTDFPMQVWSEPRKDDIDKMVGERLRQLRYEKRAHLEKALPAILQVAAASERLTVILIFDGADLIKGTPFDKDINALHKQYAREFRAAHAPFVTVLASRDGAFFDYTINYPGTVIVPHTADPLPPPETNAPPALAASPAPPPQNTNPPAQPNPPPRRMEITLSGSNFMHKASAPPAPFSNVAAVVTPPALPTPAPAPAPTPAPITNAPPPAQAAPLAVQAAHAAEPATSNVTPPEPARAPPPAASIRPPAPIVTAPPAPAPVAPAAAAVSTGQEVAMFVMAFSLLTIAVALVLLLARRRRGGPKRSLISQSMDRSR